MKHKLKKYIKPKIYTKKIKVNFFLTPMGFIDHFNLMGNIYAQSPGGSGTAATSGTSGRDGGTSGTTNGTSGSTSGGTSSPAG